MTYKSEYGKQEGVAGRLRKWAEQLGKDKTFPWPGLGLIEDLQTAANAIDGKPEPAKITEYDL